MATYDWAKRINSVVTNKMKFYAKLADWLVKANAPDRFIAFSKVSNFSKASLNRNDALFCERTKKSRRKKLRELIIVGSSGATFLHAVNRKRINFYREIARTDSTRKRLLGLCLVRARYFSIRIY